MAAKRFTVALTPDAYATLRERSAETGVSLSQIAASAILEAPLEPPAAHQAAGVSPEIIPALDRLAHPAWVSQTGSLDRWLTSQRSEVTVKVDELARTLRISEEACDLLTTQLARVYPQISHRYGARIRLSRPLGISLGRLLMLYRWLTSSSDDRDRIARIIQQVVLL